jgi:hypothetical protein
VLMLLEALLVLGSGTFMMNRIGAGERDFRSRLVHWDNGLNLLHSPRDWAFGIGLGRLPAHYDAEVPGGEFPGRIELGGEREQRFVRLLGPPNLPVLRGLYRLTQRVPADAAQPFVAGFNVRVERATRLRLSVCEIHLLYEGRCQAADVLVPSTAGRWATLSTDLVGPELTRGHWYAPRLAAFSVTVLDAGGAAKLSHMSLQDTTREELLLNRDFTQEMSHWFPLANKHFLPWHIDNLYLELLIERGFSGLLIFIMLIVCALWNLCVGSAKKLALAPVLAASLLGALTIGLVSSVMDVPRVAFLLLLLLGLSTQLSTRAEALE